MNRKQLIAIIGKKGVGKTTVLEMIARHGLYATELDRHYKELLQSGDLEAASLPPEHNWTDHIMRLVYEKVFQFLEHRAIFFCGLYRMSEIQYLWDNRIPLEICAVEAETKNRHRRVLERRRDGEEAITLEDLRVKDAKRDGTYPGYERNNINEMLAHATYRIRNDDTRQDLEAQVEAYLALLKTKGIV